MKFNKLISIIRTVAITLGLIISLISYADEQESVHWKMQSFAPSILPPAGPSALRLTKNIERLSAGTLKLKFFEPGALTSVWGCFEAVSEGQGQVDSCFTNAIFFSHRHPALVFFGGIPFGPQFGEYAAWLRFGGGDQLKQEIFAQYNIKAIPCGATGAETSGWFRREIQSLDELNGIKMRFFGLGAKVMQKLGVATQALSGPDTYAGMEKGVIDAAEMWTPGFDILFNFHQLAKFYYYPGWNQPAAINDLLVNKEAFEALSDQHQAVIEIACGENMLNSYAETEASNPVALNTLRDQHGVKIIRWSDEQLAALEKAWNEVLAEESAKDEMSARVVKSYLDFHKIYRTWGEAQMLKPTYLK